MGFELIRTIMKFINLFCLSCKLAFIHRSPVKLRKHIDKPNWWKKSDFCCDRVYFCPLIGG